jgi:hypothetical protein
MPPVGFESTISVGDLETPRMGAPYIYDITSLRVNDLIVRPKPYFPIYIHLQLLQQAVFPENFKFTE